MLYQGIIGGGSSPVEPVDLSPVLLWTNPNPTSAFDGQTVSLDLTEYAGVLVEFNWSESNSVLSSREYIKKGETLNGIGAVGATSSSDRYARATTVNSNGVTFLNASNGSEVGNNQPIPYKIYGVKEYVVEPVAAGNVYYLGTGTSFDIKTLLPDVDYAKLTSDNFIVGCNTSSSTPRENKRPGNADNEWVNANISSISVNYDNSTGILSLSGGVLSVAGGGVLSVYNKDAQLPIFAYLVTGNIVNI